MHSVHSRREFTIIDLFGTFDTIAFMMSCQPVVLSFLLMVAASGEVNANFCHSGANPGSHWYSTNCITDMEIRYIQELARERNFLYRRLRDIEALCLEEGEEENPLAGSILDVIYADDEVPTVRVVEDFDASGDAGTLRASMKGLGTDEEPITAIICNRANEQRQLITEEYTQAYGRHLLEDLKGELGGHYEDVIEALMKPVHEFLADEINHAIDNLGTDEKTLVEILCTRTNDQLAKIAEAYEAKYEKPLAEAIEGDTSGTFKRLLVAMIAGGRDEGRWGDHELAVELAEKLYDAGEGKLGTDEEEFTRIMVQYSYPQLRLTFRESEKISGKPFNEMVDDEFTGSMQKGLLAIYYSTVNRPAFFAQELHDALAGIGTTDRSLIRLLVSRSEIDLGNIKDEYESMYERSLVDHIDSDCHGEYKRALTAIVNE